jgi:hypothetical protein
MAKTKRTRKLKRSAKTGSVRRIAATKVDNKLSILLIILALLVFTFAAISMSGSGKTVTNPEKVTTSATVKPTEKPVIKATVKPTTTVKTTN